MRMTMDNPRFLFVVAVASLVLLALASSDTEMIGPCDCLRLDGQFRATFINKMTDYIVKVECRGSDIGERQYVLSPGESEKDFFTRAETWTYEAYRKPVKPSAPENDLYELIREGSIPGPVAITFSQ